MLMRFLAVLILAAVGLRAQEAPIPPPQQFMADYARLLLAGDREALIRLYAPNGSLLIGDGFDDVASLEQTADIYRNHWSAPTAFAWRDLVYRRLDPTVVAVTGGFDWTSPEFPQGARFSYHAVLVFQENKWRIRGELEFQQKPGAAVADAPGAKTGCPFCEIAAGTRQGEGVVYRDARLVAFLSIGPRNPGHVLIVPIEHAEGFADVPDETMHAMTDLAKRLVAAIRQTDLRMDGYNLQLNTGKAAGQSVFHAHLHLIPRFTGEAPAKTPEERVGMDVLAPVAAKIRAALAAGTP